MAGIGYTTKNSMAITYLFLIGGSCASIYGSYGKKIEKSNKNLIDYDLVMLTMPMTISGTMFGVKYILIRPFSIISHPNFSSPYSLLSY